MKEVEQHIGKPLLLEEFGKKLSASEYSNGGILEKRDPVFQSMYNAVEAAIDKCATRKAFQTPTAARRARCSIPLEYGGM